MQDLRVAIGRNDLNLAADLTKKLDDAVQTRYRAWLIRDASERVEEALSWLPVDTESLWINQDPFIIKADDSRELLQNRPTDLYSMDRLRALNDGKLFRALNDRVIRFVIGATRGMGIHPQEQGVPEPIAERQDVIYFYYFSEPINLSGADESIQGQPVWRGIVKINRETPFRLPAPERSQEEDENWIAVARPDLLILTNNKNLLKEVLDRVVLGSKSRALPATLPEWRHVDRGASFWGLRHYTDRSRPERGQRGFGSADLPQPDGSAIGATVRFDAPKQRLEIRYLSPAPLAQDRQTSHEFTLDQPETGVWRLISDIRERA